MGEFERQQLERNIIGPEAEADCPLQYGESIEGRLEILDGWVLPIVELKRISDTRNAIVSDVRDYYTGSGGNQLVTSDLWYCV